MGDATDTARELLDLPFHRDNGIEILTASAESAHTRWPFEASLIGNPEVPTVHGGVISALADLTGPHRSSERSDATRRRRRRIGRPAVR